MDYPNPIPDPDPGNGDTGGYSRRSGAGRGGGLILLGAIEAERGHGRGLFTRIMDEHIDEDTNSNGDLGSMGSTAILLGPRIHRCQLQCAASGSLRRA